MLNRAYRHNGFDTASFTTFLSSTCLSFSVFTSILSGAEEPEDDLKWVLAAALPSPVGEGILVCLEAGLSTTGNTGDTRLSGVLKFPRTGFDFTILALMEFARSLASSDE